MFLQGEAFPMKVERLDYILCICFCYFFLLVSLIDVYSDAALRHAVLLFSARLPGVSPIPVDSSIHRSALLGGSQSPFCPDSRRFEHSALREQAVWYTRGGSTVDETRTSLR